MMPRGATADVTFPSLDIRRINRLPGNLSPLTRPILDWKLSSFGKLEILKLSELRLRVPLKPLVCMSVIWYPEGYDWPSQFGQHYAERCQPLGYRPQHNSKSAGAIAFVGGTGEKRGGGTPRLAWKKSYPISKRLASLGTMGIQLGVSLKPLNTIVLWCKESFREGPQSGTHDS